MVGKGGNELSKKKEYGMVGKGGNELSKKKEYFKPFKLQLS
jgi:hypothetical protein